MYLEAGDPETALQYVVDPKEHPELTGKCNLLLAMKELAECKNGQMQEAEDTSATICQKSVTPVTPTPTLPVSPTCPVLPTSLLPPVSPVSPVTSRTAFASGVPGSVPVAKYQANGMLSDKTSSCLASLPTFGAAASNDNPVKEIDVSAPPPSRSFASALKGHRRRQGQRPWYRVGPFCGRRSGWRARVGSLTWE